MRYRRGRSLILPLLVVAMVGACTGSDDPETESDSTAAVLDAEVGGDAAAAVVDTAADEECLAGEICVTVTADEAIGKELRLMLYAAEADNWPGRFRSLPTPSWVVSQYPAVPDSWPLRIRIPAADNLFAISTDPIDGSRIGLAIATGVDSIMTVETTDARGFSEGTMVYEPGMVMDFGTVQLALPAGTTEDPIAATGARALGAGTTRAAARPPAGPPAASTTATALGECGRGHQGTGEQGGDQTKGKAFHSH